MEANQPTSETRHGSGVPRFDLVDIAQTLRRRRRTLLLCTLLALVGGALAYFLTPRKWSAMAEVLVANPLYADRNHIFPTQQVHLIDYFADEEAIDKAMVVGLSDRARGEVIARLRLDSVYKIDASTRKGQDKLARRYKGAYELKRTEYGNLTVAYTDTDPERAAQVANEAVAVLGEIFHQYYSGKREQIVQALEAKGREADSAIAVLTDSLAAMRDRTGIYEILSPNRMVMGASGARNGRAVEEIQNIGAVKDQWVMDRARTLGIINEMRTGIAADQTPIINVLSAASPPTRPAGLGTVLTLLACALAGFVFAVLWVLLSEYYGRLTSARAA